MAQIKGIKEIMICTHDLEKEDLDNLTSIKLKELINNKLQESAQLLYVYDEYGFEADSALSIEVCYEEIDSTPSRTRRNGEISLLARIRTVQCKC